MNYQVLLYIAMILLSVYSLSGLNIGHLFKTNHVLEAKIFIIIISVIMGYLLTNFVLNFIEKSKII